MNMMAGRFKEYNWNDIMELIYKDCGLDTPDAIGKYGQPWFVNGFNPPQSFINTIIRMQVYDKAHHERVKDHARGE
jgi:hypothetical protein